MMERYSSLFSCLLVGLLWVVCTGVSCVAPEPSQVQEEGDTTSFWEGVISQTLQLAWSIEPGDESLRLQWDEDADLS